MFTIIAKSTNMMKLKCMKYYSFLKSITLKTLKYIHRSKTN